MILEFLKSLILETLKANTNNFRNPKTNTNNFRFPKNKKEWSKTTPK